MARQSLVILPNCAPSPRSLLNGTSPQIDAKRTGHQKFSWYGTFFSAIGPRMTRVLCDTRPV